MEMLANGSIDGFIMSLSAGTEEKGDYNHLKEITSQGIPLVLFDRVTNEVECDKVLIDDKLGGYIATKKLVDEGRKRIALLTTHDYFSVSKNRNKGYRKALSDSGLEVDEKYILRLPYMDIDEQAIADFFDGIDADAVLSVNEIFGIHAMKVLQKKGYRIPEDISIIGFTDGLLAKYASPSITSIAQHGELMGETAVEMLIKKIESEEEQETYQTKILEPTLIERNSTIN